MIFEEPQTERSERRQGLCRIIAGPKVYFTKGEPAEDIGIWEVWTLVIWFEMESVELNSARRDSH
jgi:hypothetical protein